MTLFPVESFSGGFENGAQAVARAALVRCRDERGGIERARGRGGEFVHETSRAKVLAVAARPR